MTYPAASTPDPGLHNHPNKKKPSLLPATIFTALVEELFGALAVALAGINIFGVHPLEFLRAWGLSMEAQAAKALGTAQTAQVTASAATATLTAQAQAKPGWVAGDSSADASFPITTWQTLATPTYLNVTQGDSVMSFVGTPDNGQKLSIVWLGQNTTNITGLFINIYLFDTTTGQGTLIEGSPNLIADVLTTLSYNYYTLANPLTTSVGHVYVVEMVVEGTGTYQVAGLLNSTMPVNPTVYPQQQGAYRAPIGVFYDATGAGWSATPAANSASGTFSHTAAVGACVIVSVSVYANAAPTTYTRTVTYNGVAMTSLGYERANNGSGSGANNWIELFGLLGAPGGAKTVAVSVSGSATIYDIAAQSVSYTGVLSIGTLATAYGSSSTMSTGSVTSAVGSMVVTGMAAFHGSGTVTASSVTGGTSRYNTSLTGSSNGMAVVMAGAAGATSVTVTAALSSSSFWGSASVNLIPTLEPAPLDLLVSEVIYTPNVPWFALAGYTSELSWESDFSNSGTYNIPGWMTWGDLIDVAMVGAGGGGQAAQDYSLRQGGSAGQWLTTTLIYGIDVPLTTKTLTINVGAGGRGGQGINAQPGADGGDTTLTGTGVTTLTAPGGDGGNGPSPTTGYGPANTTFNGVTYTGGVNVGVEAPGSTPGGGSGAASALHAAKSAADGAAWITSYQASSKPSGGAVNLNSPAAGAATATGTATGSVVFSGTETGALTATGSTVGVVQISGSASGSATASATAAGTNWHETLSGSQYQVFNSVKTFGTGTVLDASTTGNYVPVAGDLVLCWFDFVASPTGFAVGSGWTNVLGGTTLASAGTGTWLWRTVTSAEVTAGTNAWTAATTTANISAVVYTIVLSGANATPIVAHATTNSGGTTTATLAYPTPTPVNSTDLILCGFGIQSPYTETWVSPSGPWFNFTAGGQIGIFGYAGTITPGTPVTGGSPTTTTGHIWYSVAIAIAAA